MPLFAKGHKPGTDVMVKCKNERTKDVAFLPGAYYLYGVFSTGIEGTDTCKRISADAEPAFFI